MSEQRKRETRLRVLLGGRKDSGVKELEVCGWGTATVTVAHVHHVDAVYMNDVELVR